MSKYIKLEDAIDVASKECHEFRGIFSRIKDGINALPVIEVSEDCISRKWVYNELTKVTAVTPTQIDMLSDFADIIKNAPSVVPSRAEGEWKYTMTYEPYCSELVELREARE